ncbi:MAG: 2-oxo acid dehydrogenase subunit E2, partial [Sphingomonadales bacterium]|nr:2-oxo acid dehydrogenase subunit E2 [Sphingomonadales bacterium]
MSTEVKVPTLGESVSEATIGAWLKQPGEAVALDEPIASLETDKVAIDVTAPAAGVMGTQLAKVGDNVSVGALIATIEAGSGAPAAPVAKAAEAAPAVASPAPVPVAAPAAEPAATDVTALSPAVRRAVLEYGIDPSTIKGTGKDGRITKEDVIAAAQAKPAGTAPAAPAPAAAPAASGERREERVRMTRLRQTIAKRLKSAQETAALLTTFNDVDMSAVMDARNRYKDVFEKKHGVKLGFMSFFAKAACLALKDWPAVNAQIDGDEIVYF